MSTLEMQPPSASPLAPPAVWRVAALTGARWDNALEEFADANFYQTRAYGAVSWGESQLDHCALEDGRGPAGLAQVRIVRTPLLKAGVAYVRWGPCCQRRGEPWSPESFRRMLKTLVAEYVNRRGYLLRIIPHVFAGEPHAGAALECLGECGFEREAEVPAYRTIRVDLSPEPEVIRKRLEGKWRNQLNGAERNGLVVEEGTGDDLYARFLALYDEMMARKQFETTVDVRAFRRIQERLPASQKMLIMISRKDGVPQTALVSTAVGETGIYLLGATSNDGMKSKGSYLLQWRMMNRLRERGCRWYDLGGINPEENPGVYHFKQGFGGQEVHQLGRFVHPGGFLSNLAVRLGERLRARRRQRKS